MNRLNRIRPPTVLAVDLNVLPMVALPRRHDLLFERFRQFVEAAA